MNRVGEEVRMVTVPWREARRGCYGAGEGKLGWREQGLVARNQALHVASNPGWATHQLCAPEKFDLQCFSVRWEQSFFNQVVLKTMYGKVLRKQ